MHASISSHLPEIRAICRLRGVARLDVFGSAARDVATPRDVDFLVTFHALPEGQRAKAYFGLLDDLERLLGRPVDLVMENAVTNRHFLASIAAERGPVFAA